MDEQTDTWMDEQMIGWITQAVCQTVFKTLVRKRGEKRNKKQRGHADGKNDNAMKDESDERALSDQQANISLNPQREHCVKRREKSW